MSRILPLCLPDAVWERLGELAELRGVSKSDIVRAALDGYMSDRPPVQGDTARTLLRRNLRQLRDLSR